MDVVVVIPGAGPVGLSLACELERHGGNAPQVMAAIA
jgi:2-polyprenyl-6-methoxyphenol hydroxylase-like FAD-dependent oxidoreductase